ncbi:hypothetical protein D1B31_05450 [Neobacillus notoginsengisoli]|uniref:Uncharacterized protein n=1 Tax=Neobacillus notoginsengisoli TaxID=1578198 RepID=A0A417YWW5_9BACI|nr:hypothetical protein [Neobacillus notoginsengisoli]RHW42083.1 hypothetical protein D1B31_05450 [Neobacillus notoginsengisoli]
MLSFEEKLKIIEAFEELTRKNVSLGRVNFQFEESVTDKKNVVYHLHPNGNGFVYGAGLTGYETDDRGLVNIRDFTAEELQTIIRKSISQLSETKPETIISDDQGAPERWLGKNDTVLKVVNEDELWNVYYGVNLEESFGTYREVEEYMAEEGFRKD